MVSIPDSIGVIVFEDGTGWPLVYRNVNHPEAKAVCCYCKRGSDHWDTFIYGDGVSDEDVHFMESYRRAIHGLLYIKYDAVNKLLCIDAEAVLGFKCIESRDMIKAREWNRAKKLEMELKMKLARERTLANAKAKKS